MDRVKVSRAAMRLETAGFVIKKTNPRDRRLLELSLTPKGRRLVERITPLALEYERRLLAPLRKARAESFCGAIEALLRVQWEKEKPTPNPNGRTARGKS
jgi:DNA-binding MarR family transcriptional regulator